MKRLSDEKTENNDVNYCKSLDSVYNDKNVHLNTFTNAKELHAMK